MVLQHFEILLLPTKAHVTQKIGYLCSVSAKDSRVSKGSVGSGPGLPVIWACGMQGTLMIILDLGLYSWGMEYK